MVGEISVSTVIYVPDITYFETLCIHYTPYLSPMDRSLSNIRSPFLFVHIFIDLVSVNGYITYKGLVAGARSV